MLRKKPKKQKGYKVSSPTQYLAICMMSEVVINTIEIFLMGEHLSDWLEGNYPAIWNAVKDKFAELENMHARYIDERVSKVFLKKESVKLAQEYSGRQFYDKSLEEARMRVVDTVAAIAEADGCKVASVVGHTSLIELAVTFNKRLIDIEVRDFLERCTKNNPAAKGKLELFIRSNLNLVSPTFLVKDDKGEYVTNADDIVKTRSIFELVEEIIAAVCMQHGMTAEEYRSITSRPRVGKIASAYTEAYYKKFNGREMELARMIVNDKRGMGTA